MTSGFTFAFPLLFVVLLGAGRWCGVAVECGTATRMAIGAAAGAGNGTPGTPPSGAEAAVVLPKGGRGRGGVCAMGAAGIGGVPMVRMGPARGCWCSVGRITRSRYESSSRLRSSRSRACNWRKVSP